MQVNEKRVTPLVRKKRAIMLKKVSAIAAVVIILAAIIAAWVYVATSSATVHYVSPSASVTLAHNGMFYFRLPGNTNTYLVTLENSSNGGALLYLTQLPVLNNPISAVFIFPNEGINLSLEGTTVADIHISLIGSNASYAKLSLEPVDPSLGIKAASVPVIAPMIFIEQALYTGNVSVVTTTASSTSTSTTVLTTVPSSSLPVAQLMQLVNNTSPGILMNGYKALYEKDRACSAGVYNATYYKYYNSYPSGPNSFANVSTMIPIDMNITVSKVGGDIYSATYSTVSRSPSSSGPAFTIAMNITNGQIESAVFEGIFRGLNYTQINAAYQFQNSIQNYCGAYIPYTP